MIHSSKNFDTKLLKKEALNFSGSYLVANIPVNGTQAFFQKFFSCLRSLNYFQSDKNRLIAQNFWIMSIDDSFLLLQFSFCCAFKRMIKRKIPSLLQKTAEPRILTEEDTNFSPVENH